MTELNDELLVAYVDGQLAKNQSKAVERVLEEDRIAAQRVEALRVANEQLETAFEALLAGEQIPLPEAGTGTSADGARARSTVARRLLRAGLVTWVGFGCLLGGAAAGYILHEQIAPEPVQVVVAPPPPPPAEPIIIAPPPATLQDDIARTHALLSRDTFALALDAQGNRDLVGFQISKLLGADLAIPDLSNANLTFQRAQMLQRKGTPLAQIAYLPDSGAPVALYVRPGAGEARALKFEDIGGVSLASWRQGELYFLLAGELPRPQLEAVAQSVQRQIAADAPNSPESSLPVETLPEQAAQ